MRTVNPRRCFKCSVSPSGPSHPGLSGTSHTWGGARVRCDPRLPRAGCHGPTRPVGGNGETAAEVPSPPASSRAAPVHVGVSLGTRVPLLKIKSKFSGPCWAAAPCQAPPQPGGTAGSGGGRVGAGEGAPRGGAGCSGPPAPPPLTPAVLLPKPENTRGLSSVDWGDSLIVASWAVI